jgi:hypothetical protein
MPAEFGRIIPPFSVDSHFSYDGRSLATQRPRERMSTFPKSQVIVDFGSRTEEQLRQQDYFLSPNWLVDNVNAEMRKPPTPGETPWRFLAGTGFWTRQQARQLVRNTAGAMSEVAPNVLDLELRKVRQDKEAFIKEYFEKMNALKMNLAIKEIDGRPRIVCPDYGDAVWTDLTDTMEREGAVHEALAGNSATGEKGLEAKIIEAPNKSIAIAISNRGWSGMHDADGRSINFPEDQIYTIYKDEEGHLQMYTLRYQAKIAQNEELQRKLGQTVVPTSNTRERIKNMIKNNVVITPEDADRAPAEGRKPVRGFLDVIDLMQEVVGGREEAYEGRTFDEMRFLVNHPEVFQKFHPLIDPLITRFEKYARSEIMKRQPIEQLEEKLQYAMAFTILQMNKLYREEEKTAGKETPSLAVARQTEDLRMHEAVMMLGAMNNTSDYHAEVQELKKRPGCAGGGTSNSYKTSMGGSRRAESGEEQYVGENAKNDPNLCKCGAGEGPHFHCTAAGCSEAIIVGKGITECPGCGMGKAC